MEFWVIILLIIWSTIPIFVIFISVLGDVGLLRFLVKSDIQQ